MILVTGAAGHIGNVLVRELSARGFSVRAMLQPGESQVSLEDTPVERVEADVLDYASLRRAFEGVDVVYHLAGMISIQSGKNDILRLTNVTGTRNVIEAAKQAKVKRLVYTSSIHAIRRVRPGMVIDENQPFDPDNPLGEYDRSKAIASLLVLQAAREGLDAVIVCPTGVIGPFDFRLSEMGALLTRFMNNRCHLIVKGAYDFVDVRDVALGMMLACEKGRRGEAYILSGEKISLDALSNRVHELMGNKVYFRLSCPIFLAKPVAKMAVWFSHFRRTRPLFTPYSLETVTGGSDISHAKAAKELGYDPRPLFVTVADTIQWFLYHRNLWRSMVKII